MSAMRDKVVSIRHARGMEREDLLARMAAGAADRGQAEVVVATDGKRIIGAAVLGREERGEHARCLMLRADRMDRVTRGLLLSHLMEYAGADRVSAGADAGRDLRHAGFQPVPGTRQRRDASCGGNRKDREYVQLYERNGTISR